MRQHTWYGEHEQAVLLTELLFKSTKAGHAEQEKCSLKQWRSVDENKKTGNAIETLKEIKAQDFYPNIHTLLLILAPLPFATTSAECTFICLNRLKTYLRTWLKRIFPGGEQKVDFSTRSKKYFSRGVQKWQNFILPNRNKENDLFLPKLQWVNVKFQIPSDSHACATIWKKSGCLDWHRCNSTVLRCQTQKLCWMNLLRKKKARFSALLREK